MSELRDRLKEVWDLPSIAIAALFGFALVAGPEIAKEKIDQKEKEFIKSIFYKQYVRDQNKDGFPELVIMYGIQGKPAIKDVIESDITSGSPVYNLYPSRKKYENLKKAK
jgi:hypothetical protein